MKAENMAVLMDDATAGCSDDSKGFYLVEMMGVMKADAKDCLEVVMMVDGLERKMVALMVAILAVRKDNFEVGWSDN